MPVVIRAIDLLLWPLTNVIQKCYQRQKIRALFLCYFLFLRLFYFDPLPLKRVCKCMHRLIEFKMHTNVAN
jgi:hypothetical protein